MSVSVPRTDSRTGLALAPDRAVASFARFFDE